MPTQKPYRPNVGIALFNPAGLVLIGHRFRSDGPEIILPGLEWQMPQGGVDAGEDLCAAAAPQQSNLVAGAQPIVQSNSFDNRFSATK